MPGSQKPYVAALVAFVREVVDGDAHETAARKKTAAAERFAEGNVEDMDVPF